MVLPPEINSLRMFSGAGSAPMLEAAAAWQGLAEELGTRGALVFVGDLGADRSGVAGRGVGGDDGRGGPVCRVLECRVGAGAPVRAAQANAVASAFEAAQAAMVHPLAGGGQPKCVRAVGDLEPLRAERAGDRGRRGPLRGDVGPGRHRDGRATTRGASAAAAQLHPAQSRSAERAVGPAQHRDRQPGQRQHRQRKQRQRKHRQR